MDTYINAQGEEVKYRGYSDRSTGEKYNAKPIQDIKKGDMVRYPAFAPITMVESVTKGTYKKTNQYGREIDTACYRLKFKDDSCWIVPKDDWHCIGYVKKAGE